MHDSAIQALEGVKLKTTPSSRSAVEVLAEIHDYAREQAEGLRDAYRTQLAVLEEMPGLNPGLHELTAAFRQQGLPIELLTHELTREPTPQVAARS
jgi:hypothetical protein